MREVCKDCEFSKKTLFGLKCTCESKMKVDPVTGKRKSVIVKLFVKKCFHVLILKKGK